MHFSAYISVLLASSGARSAAHDNPWGLVTPTTFATATYARRNQLRRENGGPPMATQTVNPEMPPSTQPIPRPPNIQAPTPEENVRELLLEVLRSARARDKTHECDGIGKESFYNESLKFLDHRKTEDYYVPRPDGVQKTEKDILDRLVVYQIVADTIQEQNRQVAVPETLVDQIRSAYNVVKLEGVLTGANPRVLNAIDTIYNDVCAKDGRSQIPRTLQDNIDVVVRGLEVNPQTQTPEALLQRPACQCRTPANWSPCGLYLEYYWDKEQARWHCQCYGFPDCRTAPDGTHTSTPA